MEARSLLIAMTRFFVVLCVVKSEFQRFFFNFY